MPRNEYARKGLPKKGHASRVSLAWFACSNGLPPCDRAYHSFFPFSPPWVIYPIAANRARDRLTIQVSRNGLNTATPGKSFWLLVINVNSFASAIDAIWVSG